MLEVISSIIQVISLGYVVTQIKERKIDITKIKNIILMLTMTISLYIIGITNTGFSKTIIAYSTCTLCYKYIYNISFEESAVLNFISVIIHCICEFILAIISMIMKLDNSVLEKLNLTPISGLLVFLIVIILIKIFKNKIIKLKNILTKQKNSNIFYIILLICFSILFSMNLNLSTIENKRIISNLATLLIFGVIFVFLMSERFKLIRLSEKSKETSTLLGKYKKINHENKNDLRVIKAKSKNKEDVEEYINEILDEKDSINDEYWLGEISKINSIGISNLISDKIKNMINNKIKVIVNISNKIKKYDFSKLNTREYRNLCRIIGVYLDNAYEASKDSKEKEVTIEINYIEDKMEVIISNTYKGKVDKEKLGKNGYTTKGETHGAGLSLVQDIISKSNFIDTHTEIIDNFFFQYLYF